jgi:hypothetical protein
MNRVLREGKGRSQRSSDLLRDYLEGLDAEHANLVAQRDLLLAWIELLDQQRGNLQEAIDIDKRLAEMSQRSLGVLETLGGVPKGEAAVAS